MKKITFMAVLFCLLASANHVSASNYLSLRTDITSPVNDTLRVSPHYAGTFCPMYMTANLVQRILRTCDSRDKQHLFIK